MHARARKSRLRLLLAVLLPALILAGGPALSVVEGPAQAQTPDGKYNPLLRRALSVSKPALKPLVVTQAGSADVKKIKLMLRVAPGTTKEELRALDPSFYIGTVSGGVATAEVPIALIDKLAGHSKVLRLSLAVQYKALNDVTWSSTTSGGLFLGMLSTAGVSGLGCFDGTGVVIGDTDTCIDFRPQDVTNCPGGSATSRLLAVRDQTDAGGPAPTGFY